MVRNRVTSTNAPYLHTVLSKPKIPQGDTYQPQDLHTLLIRGQLDSKPLGHSPQDSRVDIVRAVRGAQHNDPRILARCKTIPHCHELGFHHIGDFVVIVPTFPQERIDLVNEDNSGLHLLCQREQGCHQLVGLSEPLVRQC